MRLALGLGLPYGSGVAFTPSFHPTQLPGLLALYDISDLSSLFVERTGASASTPASVDGVVGTVLDLSGNGYHFTAASDAARPILRVSNGRYYLEADGVDDTLLGSASATAILTAGVAFGLPSAVTSASRAQTIVGADEGPGVLAVGNISSALVGEIIGGGAGAPASQRFGSGELSSIENANISVYRDVGEAGRDARMRLISSALVGEIIGGGAGAPASQRFGSGELSSIENANISVYRDVGEAGRDARMRLNGVDLEMLTPAGEQRLTTIDAWFSRANAAQFTACRFSALAAYDTLHSVDRVMQLEAWLGQRVV